MGLTVIVSHLALFQYDVIGPSHIFCMPKIIFSYPLIHQDSVLHLLHLVHFVVPSPPCAHTNKFPLLPFTKFNELKSSIFMFILFYTTGIYFFVKHHIC